MNIKDFLLDNYIYIIIVIVLIIITIIGFLADKKKSGAKNTAPTENTNPGYNPNVGGQINYQPGTMPSPGMNQMAPGNMQLNNVASMPAAPVEPMNNNMGVMPQPVNNQPNMVGMPQPVEPMAPIQTMPEQMVMQPTAAESQMMATPMAGVNPQPMVPNNTPQPNMMNQPNMVGMPQPVEPMAPVQTMPEQMVMQPTAVEPQMMATPMVETNNYMNAQPVNMPINNAMPQPAPTPAPIPNPSGTTVPNPITPPQPVNPTPVGFVFGPQQNNNNNM